MVNKELEDLILMDSSTKYNAIVFLLTCLLNTWILFIAQLGLNFNILKNPYAYGQRRALLLASTNWLRRYFHKTGRPKTRKAAQHKIVSLLKTPRLSVCDFSGRSVCDSSVMNFVSLDDKLCRQQCITKSNGWMSPG